MRSDEKPYSTATVDDRFVVTDPEGTVVLTCGSETGAEQYAAVLNQAWRRGYREGRRDARG